MGRGIGGGLRGDREYFRVFVVVRTGNSSLFAGENLCKTPGYMFKKWGGENVIAKCLYYWYNEEIYFDYSVKDLNDIDLVCTSPK